MIWARLIIVNDKMTTKIKLSGADESSEMPIEGLQVDGSGMSQEQSHEIPEEVERRNRQADMDRLKIISVWRRREVTLLDMMGEYGSKVGQTRRMVLM